MGQKVPNSDHETFLFNWLAWKTAEKKLAGGRSRAPRETPPPAKLDPKLDPAFSVVMDFDQPHVYPSEKPDDRADPRTKQENVVLFVRAGLPASSAGM